MVRILKAAIIEPPSTPSPSDLHYCLGTHTATVLATVSKLLKTWLESYPKELSYNVLEPFGYPRLDTSHSTYQQICLSYPHVWAIQAIQRLAAKTDTMHKRQE